MEFNINQRTIGDGHKPYLIAEMSGNHNQSLDIALRLVEEAANAGADAIKIQTYTADTLTLNVKTEDFKIDNSDSLWSGQYLYDLYSVAHTPWEWHKPIFEKASELGLTCFSTPFDETAVDFLEDIDVPAYKIASFENTHVNLIKKVAKTGKPIIISTGMAGLNDLELMVNTLKNEGVYDFALLKCTSAYPANASDANIASIPHLAEMFGCQTGLSDHTPGIGVAIASVALGATIIEKHYCLDRSLGGVDSAFSLEPNEFKQLVEECDRAWQSIGTVKYGKSKNEESSLKFRRSLYFCQDVSAGTEITAQHIKCVRPGYGLEPKYYEQILGKSLKNSVKAGDRVEWSLFC